MMLLEKSQRLSCVGFVIQHASFMVTYRFLFNESIDVTTENVQYGLVLVGILHWVQNEAA